MQRLVGAPTGPLVDNVLALLRSLYTDVQYEACELLKVLPDHLLLFQCSA